MEQYIDKAGYSPEFWKYQDDVLRVAEDVNDPLHLMIQCEEEDIANGDPQGTRWQEINALTSDELRRLKKAVR